MSEPHSQEEIQAKGLLGFICRSTQIAPQEIKGALISFLFIFLLMASYMIMKPVRDALPSDWGDVSLAQQWTYTFILSIIAVSIYNVFASRISLRVLVPSVFVFFALTFVGIFTAYKVGVSVSLLGKVFYCWTSVFSLFHISVFWSFISQQYNKEESKRLFGFINTGASAGAICGPLIVILLAENMSVENILVVAATTLLITLPLIFILNKEATKTGHKNIKKVELSKNPFSGFKEFITHRRLLGIAAFIFVFTGISSFLYSIQTDLLVDYTRAERKELLGSVELITNGLTIVMGIFLTNRLARRFGLPTSLGIVPFVVAVLLLLLSMNPVIILVLVLQVVRRAGNYAITRPSREILYTAVDNEARFKTKPIIDVAVYRGGDVFWIWFIAFLGEGYFNFTVTQLLYAGMFVALLLGFIGVYLGRKHESEEMA